jgi:hypothetical protein
MPICFRPVFNFIDNAKSTNLFYWEPSFFKSCS